MKNIITVTLVILMVFVLVGCKESGQVEPVGELELYDYSGKEVRDFFEEADADLIVLNYWATFCAPCKKEMVDLSRLQAKYRDAGVLVVGASIDSAEKLSLIKSVAGELGVNYPILYGLPSEFDGQSITGLPVTFFINSKGEVLERVDNKRDYRFFEERVNHYLSNESGSPAGDSSAVESNYFDFNYGLAAGSDNKHVLTVSIIPAEGYYLNGEGYPPLKIEFADSSEVKLHSQVLESPGVISGRSMAWEIEVERLGESSEVILDGQLSVIACREDACNIVNEKFSLRLVF